MEPSVAAQAAVLLATLTTPIFYQSWSEWELEKYPNPTQRNLT